ncbi:MAG TPA: ATP-binding cassette domain-containing protein [Thermoanaerobaculia bacterium]|jgi:ABC-type multidrug transport system ATPase subunit|nr:ATP-binding cassette domain-containing protein [Thermoanaerobaculia bacterium]
MEPIGRGGFSEVFLAFDEKLSREVALKILRTLPSRDFPTLSDQQASRFLREARLVARLDHPHIVPVYDAGVEDGVPWIAIKRVLGEPLNRTLKAGPLPPGRAVRLLAQVAEALRHAHQRGVTHRDLKPANLLIETREGGSDHVWLTDFGIAILRDEAPEGGLIIGTPGYMSPEQVAGDPVDERTDLFALGCIAAELITGRRAFSAPTPREASEAVLRGDVDLAGLDERAGRRYTEVVRRCLARSPEERWRTVEVLSQALAKIDPEAAPSLLSRLRRRSKPSSWDGRFTVQADGLTKGYRIRRPVIENLDLAIPRGAVYALLGRNGSGKTTLMRTILGLYRRDRGRIEVFGKDPEQEGPAILARVGWVPDQLAAEDRMRVRELLDFIALAYPTWDKPYCYRLVSRFDLPLESRLRDLSRGMKTKVALVMGLAHRPELILLDDATLGLDAVVLDELVDALAEANKQDGATIVLSSHSYEEAERIATHIGVLRDKSMLLSTSLEELKQRIRAGTDPNLPLAHGQELSLREIFVRLLR